jgi:hypothetical protein
MSARSIRKFSSDDIDLIDPRSGNNEAIGGRFQLPRAIEYLHSFDGGTASNEVNHRNPAAMHALWKFL